MKQHRLLVWWIRENNEVIKNLNITYRRLTIKIVDYLSLSLCASVGVFFFMNAWGAFITNQALKKTRMTSFIQRQVYNKTNSMI